MRHLRRQLAAVLAASLVASLAASGVAVAATRGAAERAATKPVASPFERGAAAVRKREARLDKIIRAARTKMKVRPLGKGVGAEVRKLSFDGPDGERVRVLLRVPGRGVGWGVRANRAIAMLSAQLGHTTWVPPAVQVPASVLGRVEGIAYDDGGKERIDRDTVMVMDLLPDSFRDGEDAPIEWLRAVREDDRLEAAVVHALSLSRDAKLANVMVNEAGELRLIDPDTSFGMRAQSTQRASSFWKGQALAYKSRQARFEDLPAHVRELVLAIDAADLETLKEVYGVSRSRRLPEMKRMARELIERGLDEATARFMEPAARAGLLRVDNSTNAIALRAE